MSSTAISRQSQSLLAKAMNPTQSERWISPSMLLRTSSSKCTLFQSIWCRRENYIYIYTHIGIYKYSVFLCHYLYITISYFFRGLFLLLSYWATTWMPFCGALRLHLGIYQLRPDARNSLSTLCLRDRRGLLGCCSGSWCCAPAFFEGRLPMEPFKPYGSLRYFVPKCGFPLSWWQLSNSQASFSLCPQGLLVDSDSIKKLWVAFVFLLTSTSESRFVPVITELEWKICRTP